MKVNKKVKKEAAESVEKKEAAQEFKYGVNELAELLGIQPASVRVRLRNRGINRSGAAYGWNTKAALQEVVDVLAKAEKAEKPEKPAKKVKAAVEEEEEEAPAPKKVKKVKKQTADAE